MALSKQNAVRTAGALWVIQLLAAIISYSVILDPIIYKQDFLATIAENHSLIKIAVLADLLCGLAVVAIAVILYPILKEFSQRMALWYFGLRIVEFVTIIIASIFLLSLLSISMNIATVDPNLLELLAKTIRKQRDWAQNITILMFSAGAIVIYILFYMTKLIPRFISIWGLIGVILSASEILFGIFGYQLPFFVYLPMGTNELFLGFWLMIKGFNPVKVELT
ncbi:MAG: DUF4386 domain-containing protein [Calditrichaeota bacterium]|nr:DUF4386 domain-containing protein [Calditrichota bacterium]